MEVNQQASEDLAARWDGMVSWYEGCIELSSTQGTVTCAVMTDVPAAKRTLEVGCGPGKHSLLLAQSYLSPDKGVLVSCDISEGMVKRVAENYADEERQDYSKIPGNKHLVNTTTNFCEFTDDTCSKLKHHCDLDTIIKDQGDFRKFVYGCRANNELLPFADGSFDSYIANLSLQIVDNPKNMIRECYRVLRSGGRACHTVWGQPKNCIQFTVLGDVVAKMFPGHPNPTNAMFDCYADFGAGIKSDMEAAGFQNVRIWEQPINVLYKTGQEFLDIFAVNQIKLIAK